MSELNIIKQSNDFHVDKVHFENDRYPVFEVDDNGNVTIDPNEDNRKYVLISEEYLEDILDIGGDPKQKFLGYRTIFGKVFNTSVEAQMFADQTLRAKDARFQHRAVPVGVRLPMMSTESKIESNLLQAHYEERAENAKEKEDEFVLKQRENERILQGINDEGEYIDEEESTLHQYTKLRSRNVVSRKRIEMYRKSLEEMEFNLKDAERVFNETTKQLSDMDIENPEYKAQSLPYFQQLCVDKGIPKPSSFEDQDVFIAKKME